MTIADFTALLPILIIAGTALTLMVWLALSRNYLRAAAVTGLGCLLALASIPLASQTVPRTITPLLQVDAFALFYFGLILTASFAVTIFSFSYLKWHQEPREEFYLLILLAIMGAQTLVVARHVASLFLGLELLTVALYPLIAFFRRTIPRLEAGIKYLILSSASSAFLLFGTAIMYYQTGGLEFSQFVIPFSQLGTDDRIFMAGLAMLLTGIGFKIGLVPFHMWTPDVYQGAPVPITAFVATVSKGAVIAVLLRLFTMADMYNAQVVVAILSVMAAASMFLGNLVALFQNSVKRLLAYSSIAHFGYLLVAFLASGPIAVEAVSFYLTAYFITTLGAFGVISLLSTPAQELDDIQDFQGLFWRNPWMAGVFAAMVLSLAGIPLTAGFIGKFYVLVAGLTAQLWTLVMLFILNSVIGLFYYLRLIRVMAASPLHGIHGPMSSRETLWAGGFLLSMLTVLLIWLGTYPVPLIELIQTLDIAALARTPELASTW